MALLDSAQLRSYRTGIVSHFYARHFLQRRGARYYFTVWMRHLCRARGHGFDIEGASIAELGPGTSLGVGIAAHLCGARCYRAFDLANWTSTEHDLRILEELVESFRREEPIPDDREFPDVKPTLTDYAFPNFLVTPRHLCAERVNAIRDAIINVAADRRDSSPSLISFVAPARAAGAGGRESVDFFLSQATLEHVDDLDATYEVLSSWLKPNGLTSHDIDFKSHGTATEWNGHWKHGRLGWRIMRGRRPFLINRHPMSYHLGLLRKNNFSLLVHERTVESRDGDARSITRSQLNPLFAFLADDDLETRTMYILARKNA